MTRRRSRGQAAAEYLVVTAALIFALLVPLPGGKPLYEELASQFEASHQRFLAALAD